MKFDLGSDLHLDLGIPKLHPAYSDTLVWAGDVVEVSTMKDKNTVAKEARKYITEMASRYKNVLWVLGNHEHYGNDINFTAQNIRTILRKWEIYNVTVLDNTTVEIENTLFFGTTMWTDMNNCNPRVMAYLHGQMNDYHKILCGDIYQSRPVPKLIPEQVVGFHKRSLKKLDEFRDLKTDKKKVVILHHGPSEQSMASWHRYGDLTGFGYVSPLEKHFEGIDLCVHGHIHEPKNYNMGNTRVISNPRGYTDYDAIPDWIHLEVEV